MAENKILNARIQLLNDTAEALAEKTSAIPLAGEMVYENDTGKMKIGDGVTTLGELKYFGGEIAQNFNVSPEENEDDITAIERVASDTELHTGDTAIVKRLIASEKYSYTAYVFDGGNWTAMDGNYSAENVYFADDLTYTATIGVMTVPSSGSGTISATGKSVKDVLASILAKEANPSTTQPSVSITCNQMKAYEVGTSVTPSYSATLSTGSYTYGPATGITATSWSVTDTNGNTTTTASGSFDAFTVEDGTSYKITATATYEAGAIPVTNLGNEYPAGQIAAGSKSSTKGTITGYRNSFYGTKETSDATVDSTLVRSLTASSKALANGNSFNLSIPVGAKRIMFAYPATLRDVTSVQDVNGMNAEIVSTFTPLKQIVSVEGANGYDAIDYKVYVYDIPNANDAANTYKVTI